MIVDDRYVILGSANINDRSMRGDRDSEIAVVIEDSVRVDTTMNGQPFVVAQFAQDFRLRLWRSHLGIDSVSGKGSPAQSIPLVLSDPNQAASITQMMKDAISDQTFHDIWKETARHNTAVRYLFGCISCVYLGNV